MNDSIWQSIAATSFWFYATVFMLIFMAYRSTKPQLLPLRSLSMMTFGLVVLSTGLLSSVITVNADNLSYYVLMYTLGMGLGWLHFSYLRVDAIAGEKTIYIPGNWITLISIICFMSYSYLHQDQISLDMNVLMSGIYSRFFMIIYGLVTGLYIGRIFYAMHTIKYGPFRTAE